MSNIDEAVQKAIDEKVTKRFNNLFARLADIEKGIKEINQRVTKVRCRLGEMGADPVTYPDKTVYVNREPKTDYQVIHEFIEFCIRHDIIRRDSPQYRDMQNRFKGD